MRPRLLFLLAVLFMLTPRMLSAQCASKPTVEEKVACVEDLVAKERAARERTLEDYVTETGLTKRNYVSDTALTNRNYVTSGGLESRGYMTETTLKDKGYVTKSDLDPYAKNTKGDYFWILLAVVLVLIMQAGFLFLEWGMIQPQFDRLLAAYKISALFMTYLAYFVGFGLMFGASSLGGFWGSLGTPAQIIAQANALMSTPGTEAVRSIGFFLFQAAFAATAVTIPSGAIAERMSVKGFTFGAFCLALFIYPVFGHWAWGGTIYNQTTLASRTAKERIAKSAMPPEGGPQPDNAATTPLVTQADGTRTASSDTETDSVGWLQRRGFHDFAGSTVVHSVGGWFALVGALMLGPRRNRFGPQRRHFRNTSMAVAWAGALFLFFGWFGFNGGSMLAYSTDVDRVVYSSVIAGIAAGISATSIALVTASRRPADESYLLEKAIGGFLGGLVAITASCDLTNAWWQSALVGVTAGAVHNLVFDLLVNCEVDDPVGAIPVHLGCGIWGTLCVAAFTRDFVAQGVGIIAAFAWTFSTASLVFGALVWVSKWKGGEWLFLSSVERRLFVSRF